MRADPFYDIKRQVLVKPPQLPAGAPPELEQKVRQTFREVLMGDGPPTTAVDRARIASEICEIIEA